MSITGSRLTLLSIILVLCTGVSVILFAHQEIEISLSEVPQAVSRAAKKAKPGINLTEAERIVDNGTVVYELEGKVDSQEFEFLISEDGTLLEMELEDD